MNWIKAALPHLTLVLSLFFIVLIILDYFNPLMRFIANSLSLAILFAFCLIAILTSIIAILDRRKYIRMHNGDKEDIR